jgi:hypothetical protein
MIARKESRPLFCAPVAQVIVARVFHVRAEAIVACYDVESCCQRLLRVNDVRDINEERMTERKPCCRAYRAAGGP